MNTKRKLRHDRQDYPEKLLYSGNDDQGHSKIMKKKHGEEIDYQGGKFSDSEVGGKDQDQQNSWQGPQEKWEQP
jgi:hypothetical protein